MVRTCHKQLSLALLRRPSIRPSAYGFVKVSFPKLIRITWHALAEASIASRSRSSRATQVTRARTANLNIMYINHQLIHPKMNRVHYPYLSYIENGKLNSINQIHLLAYLLSPENQPANLNPSPTLPVRERRYLILLYNCRDRSWSIIVAQRDL